MQKLPHQALLQQHQFPTWQRFQQQFSCTGIQHGIDKAQHFSKMNPNFLHHPPQQSSQQHVSRSTSKASTAQQ